MDGVVGRADGTSREEVLARDADPQRADNPLPKFLRDVFVNVLANLVAAAVIYLAGAAGGLLPASLPLIAASISTVLAVAFFGLFVLSRFLGERPRFQLSVAAILVFGAAIMFGTLGGVLDDEAFPRWFFFVFGAITMASAGSLIYYRKSFDSK